MPRAVFFCIAATLTCGGCGSFTYMGQQDSVGFQSTTVHASESVRQRVQTVGIVADATPPQLRVSGDYGQQTMSVGEGAATGAAEGAAMGAAEASQMISEDPRTILLAPIVLPFALIAGSIAGAAAATIEQQVQEFRDNLTDEIEAGSTPSLSGVSIAQKLGPRIDSVGDIRRGSDDADTDLVIVLNSIEIVTVEDDAIISVSATAVLRSRADGADLYEKTFEYFEFDSLRNWANSDDVRWSDFSDHANEYFAAEISANLFETIHVRNVLRPAKTPTFSGGWGGKVHSQTPMLAWELFLLGGDEYRDRIDRADVRFDLRVLDAGRIVYEARNIEGGNHTVGRELPGCRTLRWSVRPVYRFDGKVRAGEWMRYRSSANKFWERTGRLTAAPEYWAYYAAIDSRCES